ncbi:arylsulfatase [Paenibacillus mendelii]|uniref:Arylsulfatase n=1 Tax=Paenibacillus mendelii TaxID=206163 RepID=A0ABV6J825_9BACL|nr:arylsulfatase [Paenibacillus mendelii]MCQ6561416.1 arylsulfatase [Paenibacillus mendelii]
MTNKQNVILILNDDMGYSDIGCYGGEVETPNLDKLAEGGIRLTQFYNTARCSPSRASLLTGLHPHQTGIGILTYDTGLEGYPGDLNKECVTIAEVLKESGYRTYMSGKWHIAKSLLEPSDNWPMQRGFDEFYGTIIGAGSFYNPNTLTRGNENIEKEAIEDDQFFYTDAISDQAVSFIHSHAEEHPDKPFFQYVAYTAPHWPLHAHEEDIAKYKGRFDKGWDKLREERLSRMVEKGILNPSWKLSERDADEPEWESAENKEWLLRCMEVYAAQIDRMDQGIGRIIRSLEETGQLEDTVIIFLSDNGACAEDIPPNVRGEDLANELLIAKLHTRKGEDVTFGNHPDLMPGAENTYQSYGKAWANLSNTPFRLYKHWVHEGGIATPFIVHWPKGVQEKNAIRHTPAQLPDVMATILDITGAAYPDSYKGHSILPLEGSSMVPVLTGDATDRGPLYFEHEGNACIREGNWKLVRNYPGPWELYDMEEDRTELNNLASDNPERVKEMSDKYEAWAQRSRVVPREKILEIMKQSETVAFWEEDK